MSISVKKIIKKIMMVVFRNISIFIFILLILSFGLLKSEFFRYTNIESIVINASYIGILAIGMTFVLLTGGIDLSVGSVMYLTLITAANLINNIGWPVWLALALALIIGLLFGAINAMLIVKLKISPFLATLSTMIIGRGLGMIVSNSQTLSLPQSIVSLGSKRLIGIPFSIIFFVVIAAISYTLLKASPFGRHVYAVGNNLEKAKKAGINTSSILTSVYIISAFLATIAAIVAVMRIGAINASFGSGDEFDAIAAAVIGGTSLFGGIGNVFPGTVIGALIVQTVNTGLVYLNVDVYVQPIMSAVVIFLAVYMDSIKNARLQKVERRNILIEKKDILQKHDGAL